ncbi:MAG TPA: transposase [Chloroflexia bacterium]|nr:transposase [Chloroflexia bacterium]
MCTLPPSIIRVLRPFEPVFSSRVWPWVTALLVGALLTPGARTVTAALRTLGLQNDRPFQNYHRVLNRARWSSRALSAHLLTALVRVWVPADGPVLVGLDDTIERRRGAKIAAKGIYRDPVRSSKGHFVKASGVRWVSLQLLAHVPWAQRVWALPFLTVLAPSRRYHQERGARHKTLPDWGRQMLRQLRRWLPERELVAVADSSYAVIELLAACAGWSRPVTVITRLRLDAALYGAAPPRNPGTRGRPRLKGERQPTLATRLAQVTTAWQPLTVAWYGGTERPLEVTTDTAVWYHSGLPPVTIRWVLIRDPTGQREPQALLATAPALTAQQIIEWFVLRWQLEVTFQEARAHLGVETQRQWSDAAIQRTTPALLGLFSLVTLLAQELLPSPAPPVRQAAWYVKSLPTFSDALALVRRELWTVPIFSLSSPTGTTPRNRGHAASDCSRVGLGGGPRRLGGTQTGSGT